MFFYGIGSHVCFRNPGRSLLRFLVSANSLDLILDLIFELWAAVGGSLLFTLYDVCI